MSAEHVDKAIIRRIHDSINWGDVEWQDVIRIAYLAGRRDSQIQESDVSDKELANSLFSDEMEKRIFLAGLRVGEQRRQDSLIRFIRCYKGNDQLIDAILAEGGGT